MDAQLKVERDSLESRLWRMVESEIHFGKHRSVEESREAIFSVSEQSVHEYLHNHFFKKGGFLVVSGDVERYQVPEEVKAALFS